MKIARKYGALTLLGLISYFLLIEALGLGDVIYLRFFNLLILSVGIFAGINQFKKYSEKPFTYLRGLRKGMQITITAVLPFVVFLFVYLEFIDPELATNITRLLGEFFNAITISAVAGLEGMFSGIGISYACMQFLKQPREKTAFQRD
ncbi:MAG: DUF4199 domain-containing protein [Bacteroidota bacterium]